MPRNTQQIYQIPPGTYGVSGTAISSVTYNAFVDDITADLNLARPISSGGTNATNATDARSNLSVPSIANLAAEVADLVAADALKFDKTGGPLSGDAGITKIGAPTFYIDTQNGNAAEAILRMTGARTDTSLSIATMEFYNNAEGEGLAAKFDILGTGDVDLVTGNLKIGGNDIFHDGNLPEIADVTGLQAALDDKVEAIHNHGIIRITGLQTALDDKAALVHTHPISDVTGLQGELDDKLDADGTADAAGSLATERSFSISGVLTAPDVAFDGTGNVTLVSAIADAALSIAKTSGLQTALDGKAAASHAHAISDVTGLQSALDDKLDVSGFTGPEVALKLQDVNALEIGRNLTGDRNSIINFHSDDDIAFDARIVRSGGENGNLIFTNSGTGIINFVGDTIRANGSVIYDTSNFTPNIAGITGLQTALDGKAATAHSHVIADVTGLQDAIDDKADLQSPVFTGLPTVPTQVATNSSKRIASTAFVHAVAADKEDTLDDNQKRPTTISTAAPSGGSDGDIWLRYV